MENIMENIIRNLKISLEVARDLHDKQAEEAIRKLIEKVKKELH